MKTNVYKVTLSDGSWQLVFGSTMYEVGQAMFDLGYRGFTTQWMFVSRLEDLTPASGLDDHAHRVFFNSKEVTL